MGKNGKDRSPIDPNFQQVSLQFCSPCAYSNKIKIGVTLRDGFFFIGRNVILISRWSLKVDFLFSRK